MIQLWHVVAGSHEITFNARDDKVPQSLAPGSADGMGPGLAGGKVHCGRDDTG